MIYFSADWHLGHTGILIHQSERLNAFEHVEEMNAQIIDQVNAVVQPNDELYFLGDFAWQASKYGYYRQRLNVRKLYVCQGNHDSNSLRKHVSGMRDMIYRKFTTCGKTFKIHMCHYPLLSWRALHYGSIHLFGHSHGMYEEKLDQIFPGRRSMDVGIDNIYRLIRVWRPISLDEVIQRLVTDQTEDRLSGPFEVLNEEDSIDTG